jgi:hypothetical protein
MSEAAKRKAAEFARVIEKWDGSRLAAEVIYQKIA